MLSAASRGDEQRATRPGHVGRVPHVARVDRRLPFAEIDAMFLAVELLNEGHEPRDHDDELLTRRVALPGRPARVARAHHHETAFVSIGLVVGSVTSEKLRRPLEVPNRNRTRSETEMNVR